MRDVKVNQSIGYGLDEKGIDCVRKWQYTAATADGQTVEGWADIPLGFALPDARPAMPTVGGVTIPNR